MTADASGKGPDASTQRLDTASPPRNHLAAEQSPYLLQHAANPVDWYAWGDEAFARSRAEDKPIFLSVGYSTCHWCHVMAHESFEDEATAKILNTHFISVKVDREERPDVDQVYMAYVQALHGSGGWPMSVWLTPDLQPFYGGTYFPPKAARGRPGFPDLLLALAEAWRDDRASLDEAAGRAMKQLARVTNSSPRTPSSNDDTKANDAGSDDDAPASDAQDLDDAMDRAYETFATTYDPRWGGFSDAPKFPRPVIFEFLLRHAVRYDEPHAATMVLETLRHMDRGGIHDHLGGGFHRYAVDRTWHLPHFEKMLYDQAQLVTSYLEAYQLTGDDTFADVARDLCDYVLADLSDPQTGAFFSAEDADSLIPQKKTEAQAQSGRATKREGAFYVWTHAELRRLLGDDFPAFADLFGITGAGNAEDPHGELTGTNILHRVRKLGDVASTYGLRPEDLATQIARARKTLLDARLQRPRPHRDDKILTAWNGMMIAALARADAILEAPPYLAAALRAASFCRDTLWDADTRRLRRRYRDGEVAFDAYLGDYAHLVEGFIDLYEATFDLAWLDLAETIADAMIARFADNDQGGFFSTSGDDPSVLLRLKDDYDGAEPSGNATATLVLLRLATLIGREDLRRRGDAAVRAAMTRMIRYPQALPRMLRAAALAADPPIEIVLTGARDDPRLRAFIAAIHRRGFSPTRSICLADDAFKKRHGARRPQLVAMRPAEDGRPRAYLCRDHACQAPTEDPEVLAAQLEAQRIDGAVA